MILHYLQYHTFCICSCPRSVKTLHPNPLLLTIKEWYPLIYKPVTPPSEGPEEVFMNYQQPQARELYFGSGKTQKEIAQSVGVHEKTVYRWIKQDAWDQLKQASMAMPVIIADNMCNQLIALQNSIAEREEGKRIPTMQEAEIMRKLVNCITKLKDHPSLGQNIQMMMNFSLYVGTHDLDFNKKLMAY